MILCVRSLREQQRTKRLGNIRKGMDLKLSTGIGRKACKQAGRKRKKAPEEPPTGENGKKGKERTEG